MILDKSTHSCVKTEPVDAVRNEEILLIISFIDTSLDMETMLSAGGVTGPVIGAVSGELASRMAGIRVAEV